jgi:release factor glutamine methyltransferase
VPTWDDVVKAGARRFARTLDITAEEARREAQVLLCSTLGVERGWLAAHDRDPAPPESLDGIENCFARREQGEPVAYITGVREFCGLKFQVGPDVLIPRPETELAVELARGFVPADSAANILDLGTGSGAIAVALAHFCPRARITATDISEQTLAMARRNAGLLMPSRVRLMHSDWYGALTGEQFDLIVSNPPYLARDDAHLQALRFEPAGALVAGTDGLDCLRRVIGGAPAHLAPGGYLLVEHGSDQAPACAHLFRQAGFESVEAHADLAGIARVTLGRLPDLAADADSPA